MIVVSDTSPLNYLILTDTIDILPRIFDRVYAPPAVVEELTHPGSPELVRRWAGSLPEWLTIQEPAVVANLPRLDPGESAAIALTAELRADAVLIDERDGRQAARERGLQVVGTLGVLNRAARLGFIDLPQTLERLKTTNFHVKAALLDEMLRQDRERKLGQERGPDRGPQLEP